MAYALVLAIVVLLAGARIAFKCYQSKATPLALPPNPGVHPSHYCPPSVFSK